MTLCLAGLLLVRPDAFISTAGAGGDQERILDALKILGRVTTGRNLIERAKARWKFTGYEDQALLSIFKWGEVSRTDAVLTRHYNPDTGQESRERLITIYLRRNQSLEDLVLDIAHEMTHATGEQSWDPYDPDLTAGKYIRSSIEGPGGEVDAVVSECRVGMELALNFGVSAARCRRYLEPGTTQVAREKVRLDFYRVGRWKALLASSLGREFKLFPLISTDAPTLYSSTGRAPYPLALLREFEQITQAACENTRNRLSYGSSVDRSPAETPPGASPSGASTRQFLERRCIRPGAQAEAYPLQSS